MSQQQETRPFSLVDAQAGAPYACRNGDKAEIFKWDCQGRHPLGGIASNQGSDFPALWDAGGTCHSPFGGNFDLVMIPLGYLDGNPVFCGDKLRVKGCTHEYVASARDRNALHNLAWPAPEKQYPVTVMTDQQFSTFYTAGGRYVSDMRAAANAALRHAVDNGRVITLDQHDQKVNEAYEQGIQDTKGDRATRDIEIAEAVLEAAIHGAVHAHLMFRTLEAADVNLPAIIAKVP